MVKILGSVGQIPPDDYIEASIIRSELNRDDVLATVKGIVNTLEKLLPFILIDNWSEYVLYAAYILKQHYPDLVHIVSFQHNDVQHLYRRKILWLDCFEKISGVSRRINDNLINEYRVEPKKVFYKENFLAFKPKVPSFYTKDYVGTGTSISS